MDWIATLIVGLLAFLGGTGLDRFSAAGRLRGRLRAETELYSKLPESSPVRPELLLHIERQSLLMIAEEEPTPAKVASEPWGKYHRWD